MKEERFFYDPELSGSLPEEEVRHAVRVLRLREGDEIWLMDGHGTFHRAGVTVATNHALMYHIEESLPQQRQWQGHFHLAIAPTKMTERMEWMVEKCVEIGVDEISFLLCHNSERRDLRMDRLERIALSAVKQSRKAWMPRLNPMRPFGEVLRQADGAAFICHCQEGERPLLSAQLAACRGQQSKYTVFIGPEGDFTEQEVEEAARCGCSGASLGNSRLRTETAGLVAVHLMQLFTQE